MHIHIYDRQIHILQLVSIQFCVGVFFFFNKKVEEKKKKEEEIRSRTIVIKKGAVKTALEKLSRCETIPTKTCSLKN